MIDYFKGVYGINLLFRVHGSALYKGSLVGVLSVLVYLGIVLRWNEQTRSESIEDLKHPYGVGVLVSSVTFLIIFRANYGYQRYWEACVSIVFIIIRICVDGARFLLLHLYVVQCAFFIIHLI